MELVYMVTMHITFSYEYKLKKNEYGIKAILCTVVLQFIKPDMSSDAQDFPITSRNIFMSSQIMNIFGPKLTQGTILLLTLQTLS